MCSAVRARPIGALQQTLPFRGRDRVAGQPADKSFARRLGRVFPMTAAEGVSVLVASLADVIRSKSAADREKDRRALPRLHELLERTSGTRRE